MFLSASLLSILLAAMGLAGLALHAVDKRRHEVGVRKALGATVGSIIRLLSRDLVKWVLVADAIALPLVYIGVSHWLERFAYRMDITALPFVLAALLAMFLAVAAIIIQTTRAARLNPVDILRSD